MPKDFLYFTVSFMMLTGRIVFFRESEVLLKQKEKMFSLAWLFFNFILFFKVIIVLCLALSL